MSEFKRYQRKGLSEMIAWVNGFDMTGVSISEEDQQNGSPKEGDMIARNPKSHDDKWLVAKKYFEENLELYSEDAKECKDVCENITKKLKTATNDDIYFLREKKGDFGAAVRAIKQGFKVARSGWNGKGMFLFLVPGSRFKVNREPLLSIYPEGTEINYCSHVDMRTADGSIVPWLASQSDVLSEDWLIVE